MLSQSEKRKLSSTSVPETSPTEVQGVLKKRKLGKKEKDRKCQSGKKEGKIQYDDASPSFLGNIIIEAKKKMDDVDNFNGTTYLLIGGSGSGKSSVLKHVFFNHVFLPKITPTFKDYIVVLFTKSELSDAIKGIHEQVIIAPELDENIMLWARNMISTYGKEKYAFVFVMDDCIHLRNLRILEHCFLTFRNSGITSIISLQYAKNIPPGIRGTVYFACLMHAGKTSAEVAIETFVSDFLGGRNLGQKIREYVTATKDYHFYFVDNLNHKVYYVDDHYNCTELEITLNPEESGRPIGSEQTQTQTTSNTEYTPPAYLASGQDNQRSEQGPTTSSSQ